MDWTVGSRVGVQSVRWSMSGGCGMWCVVVALFSVAVLLPQLLRSDTIANAVAFLTYKGLFQAIFRLRCLYSIAVPPSSYPSCTPRNCISIHCPCIP